METFIDTVPIALSGTPVSPVPWYRSEAVSVLIVALNVCYVPVMLWLAWVVAIKLWVSITLIPTMCYTHIWSYAHVLYPYMAICPCVMRWVVAIKLWVSITLIPTTPEHPYDYLYPYYPYPYPYYYP